MDISVNNLYTQLSPVTKSETKAKAENPPQEIKQKTSILDSLKYESKSTKSITLKELYSFVDEVKSDNRLNEKDIPHRDVIGAYFDKTEINPAVENKGLSAKVKLPVIEFDPARNDDKFGRLDIPSLYMGGNASGKELDAGLTWDKVYDDNGNQTFTDAKQGTDGGVPEKRYTQVTDKKGEVIGYKDGNDKLVAGNDEKGNKSGKDLKEFQKDLQPNYAFRPCWRTTNSESQQLSKPEERQEVKFNKGKINIAGKDFPVTEKNGKLVYKGSDKKEHLVLKEGDKYFIAKNVWHNPNIHNAKNSTDAKNVYFYPGQDINMSINTAKDGKVTLSINSKDKNFKQNFYAEGFGKGTEQSFKAVSSIDQFTTAGEGANKKRLGLEGLKAEVLPTSTRVTGAKWDLDIIKNDGKLEKVNSDNSFEFRGSDTLPEDFTRNNGQIDITPNKEAHNNLTYVNNTLDKSFKKEMADKLKNSSNEINKLGKEIKELSKAKKPNIDEINSKLKQVKSLAGIDKNIDSKANYLQNYFIKQNIDVTQEELQRAKDRLNKIVDEMIKAGF